MGVFKKVLWIMMGFGLVLMMGCPNPTNDDAGGINSSNGIDWSLTMVDVPAGSFQQDAENNNVSIISDAYRMSQHEITRQQFLDIMGSDPSDTGYSSGMSDPVQEVNWYHAIAFCNKLSIEEGLERVYSVTGIADTDEAWSSLNYASIPTSSDSDWDEASCGWDVDGYRLPTEMEWMWAAMSAEDDYTKDFAGDDGTNSIDEYAWYYWNSGDEYLSGERDTEEIDSNNCRTHPVGEKNANEIGLHDMSGNVWEWCWDWYVSDYPTGEVTDYRGAASGTNRVMRGGSWDSEASYCTVAIRFGDGVPYAQFYGLGFRVVRP